MALSFYDGEADTLWLSFTEAAEVRSELRGWGAVTWAVESDRVVAAELWSASEFLPDAVLSAVPLPTDTDAKGSADLGSFDRKTNLLCFRPSASQAAMFIWPATRMLPCDLLDLFPPPRGPEPGPRSALD